MKTIRYEQGKVPALTPAQIAELHAMTAMPDKGINFEDIPAASAEAWKNASIGRFYKPTKTPTTVRVDTDVLAWLKAQGRGYQTRINSILRNAMMHEIRAH